MPEISIHPDRESLIREAANVIVDLAASAIQEHGRFALALAGGDTPRPVYARMADPAQARRVDWARVEVFFGDERSVPPDDSRSNYRMVREALLDHVRIPSTNIHRIRGEDEPEKAAAEYEAVLRRRLGDERGRDGPAPGSLDLILLGMGDDGHTASLFPGTPAVMEQARWVLAQFVETLQMWRVTLTPVVINASRNVLFLVSGAGKAEMLRQVLEGAEEPLLRPAQVVRPSQGRVRWLVDAAAAARLRPST
jgi:6-phosphogluconolactonase